MDIVGGHAGAVGVWLPHAPASLSVRHDTTPRRPLNTYRDEQAMIELQILAALSRLDRARERILARRPRPLGSPPVLAAAAGVMLGWVVRGMILRGAG